MYIHNNIKNVIFISGDSKKLKNQHSRVGGPQCLW
jgi:hypothetical protein